ncbi:MAG TPA: DoxX family protein [Bryobacteraceae bacterium]|nr:DoxX family protein [Bryobacteraceae bacterium]
MQRLFSTFADGWPGVGLLLLRLLTALALVHFGLDGVPAASSATIVVPQIIGVAVGILLLVGLWTPVAGALAAIVEVWIAASRFLSQSGDPWMPIIQALLGVILAMVGPGVWSIDARLFGRRRIAFPERVEFFSPDRGTTKSHHPANE